MVQDSKYAGLAGLTDEKFRRLTGVKRATFAVMASILARDCAARHARGGRPNGLIVEDRLLLALEYLREYRTYFHIGQNYGVSESYAYKICRWVEDTLVADGTFALPGRKALLASDMEYEVIMVDATETPCERPKKGSGALTLARRSAIR
jgi:Helix-turn-helix of DDE superfamily endonuclease